MRTSLLPPHPAGIKFTQFSALFLKCRGESLSGFTTMTNSWESASSMAARHTTGQRPLSPLITREIGLFGGVELGANSGRWQED